MTPGAPTSRSPLISVYIPSHNYGRFLADAVQSVRDQSYPNWELIVVDDGSTDDTSQVLEKFDDLPNIRIIRHERPRGLRAVANRCFGEARGEFILRLDGDDLLHPRALELLVAEVQIPGVAFVFPDYYYLDELGHVIGVETLPTVSGEYEARSIPPHGAGSLVRLDLVRGFGGFDETLSTQDGHELWLRVIESGALVHHVALPLFFYRQHPGSLSGDETRVLADRASIKRRLGADRDRASTIIGVLTVCNTNPEFPDIPFTPFGATTLLDWEIEETLRVQGLDGLVVTTDSSQVASHVRGRFPTVTLIERAERLRHHDAKMREILREVTERLALPPSALLCVLNLHTPFRRARHIRDAIDNFNLYEVDSVVTVYEERNVVYQMGSYGMEPMNPSWQYMFRREREVVYVDNSAVRVLPVANLARERFLGVRIGHVLMSREEGFKINSPSDLHRLAQWKGADAPQFA